MLRCKEITKVLDILWTWFFFLRFCESNTSCLSKVLEFLLELFDMLKTKGYIMTESEAAIFLPCLFEKMNMDIFAIICFCCCCLLLSAGLQKCQIFTLMVLAITEDLHDVHNLGKEAATEHVSLMGDLSKANSTLLLLESVLSKDVTTMTDAMARERETKMEISLIHGQAIYQSYYSTIKEACQAYKLLVPSLISYVKGLHSMLTRLERTASLHAGNLHKALEVLVESQEIRS